MKHLRPTNARKALRPVGLEATRQSSNFFSAKFGHPQMQRELTQVNLGEGTLQRSLKGSEAAPSTKRSVVELLNPFRKGPQLAQHNMRNAYIAAELEGACRACLVQRPIVTTVDVHDVPCDRPGNAHLESVPKIGHILRNTAWPVDDRAWFALHLDNSAVFTLHIDRRHMQIMQAP